MTRVRINASGTIYEITKADLEKSDLYKLLEHRYESEIQGEQLLFTIDRPSDIFGSVLAYLQTGKLHMPTGVCPGAFRQELEYWNVDPHSMQSCCLYRYQAFLDDEETRHKFLNDTSTLSEKHLDTQDKNLSGFESFRKKLWDLVDNNEVSIPAKIYFGLVSLMVMASILSLSLSTEPSFRRGVTECELLEYMEYTNDPDLHKVEFVLGNPDCSRSTIFSREGDLLEVDQYDWEIFEFSNGTLVQHFEYPKNSVILLFLRAGTRLNLPKKVTLTIPDLDVPVYAFYIIDMIFIVFFTVDITLRFLSCPSRSRYFCSPINVFDILALVSTYACLIVVSIEKQYRYVETPWLRLLNFLLVFRALRLFRIVKNVRASKVLAYSLTQNVKDMSLLVLLLFIGISAFACLFYFSETRDTVPSIPVAWYWAIVTMTTVGYGDISPSTELGRALASICAICGVLLLAVTLPMFVNNFLSLYQYSCVNESIEKNKGKVETENDSVSPGKPDSLGCADTVAVSHSRIFDVKPMAKEKEALY